MIHRQYYVELEKQEKLLSRKNQKSSFYNGIYDRYEYPVLTRDHAPLHWRYDLCAETNPHFMERLGINAVMNSGAIELDGKFYLVARVEGNDRKSFFAVAESDSGVDGFRFWDYPVVLPDTCPEETNVYDMRLTKHEDGFIDTGSGGGIGFGLCGDIEHAVIDEETIVSRRVYHTLTECKNGAGAVPIRGKKCWIHIAHGVRNTAAGLRYVLYAFGTDLKDPSKLVAEPSGVFLVPLGAERVGDVSNVVFTSGRRTA